jgi:transcriptional regulator with XRE-family HTH domain
MPNAVADARLKAGLTQAELARQAGVPIRQVVAIESGQTVALPIFERVIAHLPCLMVPLSQVDVSVTDEEDEKDDVKTYLTTGSDSSTLARLFYHLGGTLMIAKDPGPWRPPASSKRNKETEALLDGLRYACERGDDSPAPCVPFKKKET